MTVLAKFKCAGSVTIADVNPRKEGEEGSKALAADVKMAALMHVDEVARFFDLQLPFFLFDADGDPRQPMMGAIVYKHALQGYRLYVAGSVIHNCTVKKFSIEPVMEHKVLVRWSVAIKPEITSIINFLERRMEEEVEIELAAHDDKQLALGLDEIIDAIHGANA